MNESNIPIPNKDIACQYLIVDQSVVHHGNLRRRRLLNNLVEKVSVKQLKLGEAIRWRQSYVVLHNGCIYVYDDEMSTKPVRATSLYGFTGVELCSHEVSSRVSWPFKLVCALEEKDRNFYFSAPSEKDMKVWIKCLEEQILAVFKMMEKYVPKTLISPKHVAYLASSPPLPPPRSLGAAAEQVTWSDEEDSFDYSEILDEDLDELRINKVQTNKESESRKSILSQSEIAKKLFGKGIPLPKPKAKAGNERVIDSAAGKVDSLKSDESINYVGTSSYGEFKYYEWGDSGIPPEAFWNGEPSEADGVMRRITCNGAYMIRNSSERGAQTLLVRVSSNVVKFKILIDEQGRLSLMKDGPYFDSIGHLVEFYRANPVPRYDTPLTSPYAVVTTACT